MLASCPGVVLPLHTQSGLGLLVMGLWMLERRPDHPPGPRVDSSNTKGKGMRKHSDYLLKPAKGGPTS